MKVVKRILLALIAIAAIAVLFYSGGQLYTIYDEKQQVNEEQQLFEEHVNTETFSIDWNALLALNPDIKAWIYIPDTEISFAVVQGADDVWYLNHTYLGEESIYGAIFISSINSPNFTDDNTIIYGHSTDVGGMFTSLVNFEDQEYFFNHRTMWILTPQKNYECTIFAFLEQDNYHPVYSVSFGDETEAILNAIWNDALYKRSVDFLGKKIVTLSTCDLDYGFDSEQRLILCAVYTP